MPRIARLLRFWPKRPAIAECRCATLADAGLVSVPARDRNQGSGLSGRDHERVELAAGLAAGELCISRRRPQHRPASMLARYPPIARTLPHPAGPAVARRRLRAAAACTRRYEEPNARLGLLPLGEAKQSRRLASRFARRTFAKSPDLSLGYFNCFGARLARRAAGRRLLGLRLLPSGWRACLQRRCGGFARSRSALCKAGLDR